MKAEGCLVHSLKGLSRSCCIFAGYFMRKFRWTLYKTLEFLHSRRPDLEIRATFFSQMNKLEARLSAKGGIKYNSWDDLNEEAALREEEIIIRNTFLNSKQKKPSFEEFMGYGNKKSQKSPLKRPNINWIDDVFRDKSKLVTEIKSKRLLANLAYRQSKTKKFCVKPILKQSNSDPGINNSLLVKNPLKTLNNFNFMEPTAQTSFQKPKGNRPSTPNPEHQRPEFSNKTINSLKDSEMFEISKVKLNKPFNPHSDNNNENLTQKTMNNLKELENSKNIINNLLNKNPLLMRKKVNNFLEDQTPTNKITAGSDKNIEIDKNHLMINANSRSSSLPKKGNNNNDTNSFGHLEGVSKKNNVNNLNKSQQSGKEEDEKKTNNENINYQKLLFENGNHIKKQVHKK
jgi:hypothetical protein